MPAVQHEVICTSDLSSTEYVEAIHNILPLADICGSINSDSRIAFLVTQLLDQVQCRCAVGHYHQ